MNKGRRKPYDYDMEELWLGTLFRNPEQISGIITEHGEDLMHSQGHLVLWRSMMELYKADRKVDPMAVASHVKTHGYLEEKVCDSLIQKVVMQGAGADHMDSWTEQLAELSSWREVQRLSLDLQQMAGDSSVKFDKVMDEVFTRLQNRMGTSKPSYIGDISREMMLQLQNDSNQEELTTGLLTGFFEIDRATGGFEPDDFVGMAARPRVGKTSAALQMARNILFSTLSGVVVLFSLEMSPIRINRRCVSALSGISYGAIRQGNLTDKERVKVMAAYQIMEALKDRFVIFTPRNFPGGFDHDKILQAMRSISMRMEVLMFITDNFQRLPGANLSILNQISRSNKDIADITGVPNMMLLQIGRIVEKENRPPKIGDIKDCGQIEQDLDRLFMIDRPDLRNSQIRHLWQQYGIIENVAEWSIAKNRDGPESYWQMLFDGPTMKFTETSAFGATQGQDIIV